MATNLSNPSPYATGSGKRGSKKPTKATRVTIAAVENGFTVDCSGDDNQRGPYKPPKTSVFPTCEAALAFAGGELMGKPVPDDESAEPAGMKDEAAEGE